MCATFSVFGGGGERMVGMKEHGKSIVRRIRSGEIERKDVVRRLAELAFGRVNDCVKLALEENVEPEGLDLSLLAEVRRNEKGAVEIRLVDRLKVLQQLAELVGKDGDKMGELIQALQGGEKA